MNRTVQLKRRDSGVAVLVFESPDRPVNVLSREMIDEVGPLLDEIERDPTVTSCVLISGKEQTFVAGADLDELTAMKDSREVRQLLTDAHHLLDRIESSRKPFVAAIHGGAFGGGLEVALACHHRVATAHPHTVFSFPEVGLGLIPAGGGTQRLPRLIGLEQALPMLLKGSRIHSARALDIGLIDEIASRERLLDAGVESAGRLLEDHPEKHLSMRQRVALISPLRRHALSKARDEVMDQTAGLYPAPLAVLDCVGVGLERGPKSGKQMEIERFIALLGGEVARNLIWSFRAVNRRKKPPADPPARRVTKLTVIGAGLMGEGIASISLPHAEVWLEDLSGTMIDKAISNIEQTLWKRVRSGSVSEGDAERQRKSLHTSLNPGVAAGSDLVIEAVFEELGLKRQVLEDCEPLLGKDAIYASNTSAIPIRQIAASARNPERVIGMHYFSPVLRMPLLELVVTPETSGETMATARSFAIAQGKTVIVVNDSPGFYTTRILAPYMNEAVMLLDEGADVRQVDAALVKFGFPLGPISLLDEVGLDVAAHISEDLGRAFATRGHVPSATLEKIVRAGYSGKKNGRGFYQYDKKSKRVNDEIYGLLGGPDRRELSEAEINDRLVLAMINEAAHALEEEVISSPTDGDLAATLGLGFPPFRGGPFHYADAVSPEKIVRRLEELATRHGRRFQPAPLLRRMAANDERFFSKDS
ncbi:MAG: 3-hydroxyacyl-CoA dehydrogenase NAD-binding domain-containing protein [Acidobacteriota bacterium]